MTAWAGLGVSVASALLGSVLACIPGLHVYNVLGLGVLLGYHLVTVQGSLFPPELVGCAFVGAIAAYSVVNSIPAVFLCAPDESAAFVVLPSSRLRSEGRGFEAVMLMTIGATCAAAMLIPTLVALGPRFLPVVRSVLQPHLHWIVWCIIGFMLLAEWTRGGTYAGTGLHRLADAWRPLGASLATFVLAGLLGFILFYRPPYDVTASFQGLMPAFVGLYTLPWLVSGVLFASPHPHQAMTVSLLPSRKMLHGAIAGVLGGGVAGFVPGVTGGVGGMLAAHATAIRGDREFLVSQGASKVVYYVGGFLLLYVPGVNLPRGGGAALASALAGSGGVGDFYLVAGAAALGVSIAVLLVPVLSAGVARVASRFSSRSVSGFVLAGIVALIALTTGPVGLAVAAVSWGIGMLPSLYGARRMNCLAVVLVPIACNLSGIDGKIASWLGLA